MILLHLIKISFVHKNASKEVYQGFSQYANYQILAVEKIFQ